MIRSIFLRNFKAFESLNLPIAPLTLLTGVNGSGKSSVLQSLVAIRQSSDANALHSEGLLLNGELVELGSGKDAFFEYASTPEIEVAIDSDDGLAAWRFGYAERADLLDLQSYVGPEFPSFLDRPFQYLRADRISPSVVFPKSYAEVVRRKFLGVRGQFTAHFLAALQDQPIAEGRRVFGAGPGLLSQASAWLSQISPGAAVGAREVPGADLAQLWFTFGGTAGLGSSNEYRSTNVGYGLTYALPMIVACLSADQGDLLLLENPEGHLHPKGQAVLGSLIAATAADGVQVIFETHSEHVLNSIRLAIKREKIHADLVKVHFFEPNSESRGAGVVTPDIGPDGRLSFWPSGFFDEWEKALVDLI